MVGLDASGKRSTCNPLASRYSVMPSTVPTLRTPGRLVGSPRNSLRSGRCRAGSDATVPPLPLAEPSPFVGGTGVALGGADGTGSGGAVVVVPGAATGGLSGGCGGFLCG